MKEIQVGLGHSNNATTANIYAHLDLSSKEAAAQTIAGCLPLGTDGTTFQKTGKAAAQQGKKKIC